jgi:hypothetical protein
MSTTGTITYEATATYSVADIKRVLDNFAAEFTMISQATGLRTREYVESMVSDLKVFAEREYISHIHLILYDNAGKELRAARYTLSDVAQNWAHQNPGNNLWPRTPGGDLRLYVSWTQKYLGLSETALAGMNQRLNISWQRVSIDLSHPGLVSQFDRRFASNGYGMEKHVFKAL